MIQAKVVADSVNEFGNRITSLLVTMPRYILAEFNTHRMLSKNSASSRAIPFEKNLKSVMENPFIPVAWMKDHKGMQGTEYFMDDEFLSDEHGAYSVNYLKEIWLDDMKYAIKKAKKLNDFGVTKQMCNRLLEPFMWHTVLVTATEWENFFALRCPQYSWQKNGDFRSWKDLVKQEFDNGGSRDWVDGIEDSDIITRLKNNKGQADIHMMLTAEAIWDAMNESTPKLLEAGQWHIPFGDTIRLTFENTNGVELSEEEWNLVFVKIATARCAQTSYTVIGEDEKELNYEKLIALHDKLSKSGHWSPFEHCAKCMTSEEYELNVNGKLEWTGGHYDKTLPVKEAEGWSGNFRGFIQYRKSFANENITK